MRAKSVRVFQWYLVVEGASTFPFDMLRYDSCFPFEQEDSTKLEEHRNEHRRVVLVRRGVSDQYASVDRWKSFGWQVVTAETDSGEARRVAKEVP